MCGSAVTRSGSNTSCGGRNDNDSCGTGSTIMAAWAGGSGNSKTQCLSLAVGVIDDDGGGDEDDHKHLQHCNFWGASNQRFYIA